MRGKVALGAAGVLALAAGLIVKWEGVEHVPYKDPIGIWTVCVGHTGPDVIPGKTYTQAECDAFLKADMLEALSHVDRCIPPRAEYVTAALVSATFNVGPRVVCGSTLQRKAKAGDWAGACAELDRWKYAGGRVFKGLVLRRKDERAMCEGRLGK